MTVHHDASFCARDRCQGLAAEVEQLRQQVRVLTGLHRSAEEEVEQLREEVAEHLLRADSLRATLAESQAHSGRLEAAIDRVRALPVHWASLTTEMQSTLKTGFTAMTVMQAVVRKADLDAALDGERDE